MGGTFSKGKVWSNAETLTASDLNTKTSTFIANYTPAGVDDISASDTDARTTKNPYSGGIVYPVNLKEEIQMYRFILDAIIGETYWYQDVPKNIPSTYTWLTGNLGTRTFCFQNAAPTGWSVESGCGDGLCAVKSSSGDWNQTGGSKLQGTWQHYHADRGHILTISEYPSHSHTLAVDNVVCLKDCSMTMKLTNCDTSAGFAKKGTYGSGYNTGSNSGNTAHDHGDSAGAKVSGGSADAWRPVANVGIIIARS